MLEKFAAIPGRVIDLGCGNGAVARVVRKRGYEVVGIDAAVDGIEFAKTTEPEAPFFCASLDNLLVPVVGGAYDAAYSLEVVEHLYQPRNLFRRAIEVIKPGGHLVVSTPYHGYLKNLGLATVGAWDRHLTVHWDGGHIKLWSRRRLTELLTEAGFNDVRFAGAGRVPYLWKSMVITAERP